MDNIEKHLDPLKSHQLKRPRESNEVYLHEKEIRVDENGQESPTSMESPMESTLTSTMTSAMGGTTMVPETPMTPAKAKMMEDEVPLPPDPKPRRICGMRRRTFWILFTILLAVIVVAAIVGGVIGGMKHPSNTSAPSTTAAPAAAAAPTTPVAPTVEGPLL